MANEHAAILVRLSDTNQAIANPADDVRGRVVKDCTGEDIGTVEDLLIDPDQRLVRLLRIAHGGLFGLGATSFFIPVEAVVRVDHEQVVVDQSRQRVAEAPHYNPDLTDQRAYYDDLYGYYGYVPYWAPDYPPPRPYRRQREGAADGSGH